MIKTLHITNAYHEASGGIRTLYQAAMRTANELGLPFRLVVPAARTGVEAVGEWARIYRVAAPRTPFGDRRYRLLLPHAYLFSWGSTLRRILLAEQPDLVEITDKYTLPYLAGIIRKGWIDGLKRPVVVGLSCERMDDNVRAYVTRAAWGAAGAREYMRRVYVPLFDAHLAMSDYIAEELRRAAGEHPIRPVHVCPGGVDASGLSPARRSEALRAELLSPIDPRRPALLLFYAGRLAPEKNLELLAETMARLAADADRDYRLVVAGSGPLHGWLEETAARRFPGRLRSLGQVGDRGRLATLYASADAFIHPNPREPFGIAPLEAMASGCPLIVPNQGGVLTYASDDTAWVAPPTGEAFAEAARRACTDSAERRRRIEAARRTAVSYDWPVVMPRWFELYHQLHSRSLDRSVSHSGVGSK